MSKFRALLVDDEKELMTAMVERLGYRDVEADYALSGAEAIEKMRNSDFDVIVIDLKMPGMSGTELIGIIKRDHPQVPVILMTGHGFSLDGEDVPEGVVEFLPKPVNIEELIEKMQKVIRTNGL
ncbi:response regulator [candidate division LCP-89 bacterium B3_LCP]|uniref:Response regulator n=1 Tax=candidate division LCP-89 bacterium B3_LCP TaxID=2012998 RepID=A0A532UXT1_UNCL8|nr:MAG: response regulator [candidate division LCP-89 bacterium B3_LCP]